jgi:hypothetical protein
MVVEAFVWAYQLGGLELRPLVLGQLAPGGEILRTKSVHGVHVVIIAIAGALQGRW